MELQPTVIIPAYNAAGTLPACLEAVLCSNSRPLQVIVVDDGSTDATAQIADTAGVEVIRQERQGPAAARNAGARQSKGDVLVFLDADVVPHPRAIDLMLNLLEADSGLAAVFGSYDSTPRVRGLIAQYRNLLHAYTHQIGSANSFTFWAGLGAVRRKVFESVGGFDSHTFESASIEDIEFGMRLTSAGCRIRLDRRILGSHCKEWTLASMVQTDLWCRAVPWTRILRQARKLPNDLNLRWTQRFSVAAAWSVPPSAAAIMFDSIWTPTLPVLLILYFALNAQFFVWIRSQAGARTAAASIPLHLLFHWVAGLGFLIGNLTGSPAESRTSAERGAART